MREEPVIWMAFGRRSRTSRNLPWELRQFHDILSLIPLRPFGNIEFYVITFIQRLKAAGLNSGMVHENIIPGIAPDESVAFFIVKPFNYALFFHFSSYLLPKETCAARRGTFKMSVFVPFTSQGEDESKRWSWLHQTL